MTGRAHFAGWCRDHHLVEATTSIDIHDGDTYVQSCATCERPTYLDRLPENRIGKPVHEHAVFEPLRPGDPINLATPTIPGRCISRGYITPAMALQYAEPGQVVVLLCPDAPGEDRAMMACSDCLVKFPSAARTVLAARDSMIKIEFTRPNGTTT